MQNQTLPSKKKTKLSVCDFRFESQKQTLTKSIREQRRSQPVIHFVRKNQQKESIREPQQPKLPTIHKIQTIEIDLTEKEPELKLKEPTKPKHKIFIKKNPSKEKLEEDIHLDTHQKPFYINNLELGEVNETKKQIINKIINKIKDVDRKRRSNLSSLFKKICNSPEQLKTKKLKYSQHQKIDKSYLNTKKTFHYQHRQPSNEIIKEENYVSGWNIRSSQDTIQHFYILK